MTAFFSRCGGNGGISPLVSPEEVLELIGEHLGAESDAAPSSTSTKVDDALIDEQTSETRSSGTACRNLRFSCPALSLAHKEHLDMDHSSRRQAERYAVSLLSRPLLVGEKEDDEEDSSTTTEASEIVGFPCKGLPEAPAVLLRNIYESFAMLVDSRLRAYATFMARHCDTLARSKKNIVNSSTATAVGVRNVEQKLVTLLGVGSRIEASSMRTIFEVTATTTTDTLEEDDEDLKHKSYSLPLRFEAVINLIVPGPSGEVDNLSVAQTTTGVISGKTSLTRHF